MFISFFTGKVMLFYGISLIMKEKSNASALRPRFAKRHGDWIGGMGRREGDAVSERWSVQN